MICTSCQADNPAHAKFCFNCGTALEAPPSEGPSEAPCRSCGSSLPVDARFCGYCGTPEPIASATAPEPAAPEPAPPPQPPPVPAPPPTAAAPPQPGAAAPPPESEDDEATVQRTLAEVVAETPIAATPGSLPRGKAKTEPAKVIASRTLAERLGRGAGAVEAGTYSKQGPSLRKSEGKRAPPPPPAIGTRKPIGAKAGSKVPPPPGKPPKPATARDLPRMSAIPAPPGVGAPSVRTRTKGKGRPAPPPGPVPMPVAAKRPVPAKPAAALREVAEPSGGAVPPAVARTVTERTPVDEGSPGLGRSTPSEAAAILAPVEGWPDITEELDEVRFSALQGVDDGVRDEVFALQRKYPGHPDVTELAAELNVELESTERAVPPSVEPPAAAAEAAPSEQESSEPTPSVDRSTMPPVIAPESGPLSGAPEPTGVQTSDELLDDDDMVFADLESSDSATDMALMDDVDLSDIEQTGPTPSPVDPSPPEPQRQFDDLDLDDEEQFDRTQMVRGLQPPAPFGGVQPPSREVFGEDADVDESSITLAPGMNEGTSVGPAPGQNEGTSVGPAPGMNEGTSVGPAPGMNEDTSVGPAPERNEGTNVGPVPGLDEGTNVGPVPGLNEGTAVGPAPGRSEGTSVTFAPGSALDDDEMGVTLPPGGMVIKDGQYVTGDDEPTYTGDGSLSDLGLEAEAEPPQRERSSTLVPGFNDGPPPPAPYQGPGGEPPPEGMTAPDREADSAAASGSFRVSDLGLDELPDLDSLSSDDALEDLRTEEGTVVARSPLPPAPYGTAEAPLPIVPVRLVMLGPRGEVVTERRIDVGSYFDIGRQPGEPWAEDRRMETHHARMFPAAGGVVVDDFGRPAGVYTKIFDTIVVEDGDEFKVGQARLALQRHPGPGGSWGQLTMVRHDSPDLETYALTRDEIIIGRDEGDIVLPNDTFVSGDHCRFIREGNAVYLEDLGSSNGTYIRVRAGQCVAFGGLLLVGHTQFKVVPG